MTRDEILDELGRLCEELATHRTELASMLTAQEQAYTATVRDYLEAGQSVTYAKEQGRIAAASHVESVNMTRLDVELDEDRRDHLRILLTYAT